MKSIDHKLESEMMKNMKPNENINMQRGKMSKIGEIT